MINETTILNFDLCFIHIYINTRFVGKINIYMYVFFVDVAQTP